MKTSCYCFRKLERKPAPGQQSSHFALSQENFQCIQPLYRLVVIMFEICETGQDGSE